MAALGGGRLTSDGGVLLLAEAERELGLCDRMAALISDPLDPSQFGCPLADILRARILAIACGYEDATTSTTCAGIPASSWPVAACLTAGGTCAHSRALQDLQDRAGRAGCGALRLHRRRHIQ